MTFEETIKAFSSRVIKLVETVATEEATKTSLIMPFFQILGYDVFNPLEFIPEFTADVGIKKGEKVDYAIFLNNEPVILIEAKSANENLTKHDSQLFRYFSTTKAKFAILTNGLNYRFYTDLDEPNKMDENPFFEIVLSDLKDQQIIELKKFKKENFNIDEILDTASELKYTGLIKNVLKDLFATPSDDFVKLVLNNDVYNGVKTQNVVDKFKPLIKRGLVSYVNEIVNDRIQNALNANMAKQDDEESNIDINIEPEKQIITTEEELESYYIIKSILRNVIDQSRLSYKDTLSYFSINVDNKVTKWLCRLYFKENKKFIVISSSNKNDTKIEFDNLDALYTLSEQLIARLNEIIS